MHGELAREFLVRSRVHRPFCFALLCDSLSFACPKESKQRKRHPGCAPALRAGALRCSVRRDAARTRIALAILKQLAAPAPCAGHPSALRFSSLHMGPEYRHGQAGARRCNNYGVRVGQFGYVPVGLAFGVADQRSLRDLGKASASRSLSVFGPLGRSAEQRGPQAATSIDQGRPDV